ncbi:MAG: 7TM diverse intracellular signaling domain-containing protein [Chitinophagaceae bacterium]
MLRTRCLLILVFSYNLAYSNHIIVIDKDLTSRLIAKEMYYLEDKTGKLPFEDIYHSEKFLPVDHNNINFRFSESVFWLKLTIANKDSRTRNLVEVSQPLLMIADFYYPGINNSYKVDHGGQTYPFSYRKYKESTGFLFDLDLNPGEEKTFYLKIRSRGILSVPVQIITWDTFYTSTLNLNLLFGIYCGIIMVMVIFNFFIYLSIRDKSYLYYILHTFFAGLTQASLLGFTYKYFWPYAPWFGNNSNFLFTCLASVAGVQFLIEFMNVRKNAPMVFKILKAFQAVYLLFLLSGLSGIYSINYSAILMTHSLIAIFILVISIYLYKRGLKEAKYYIIGWSSLLLCIIIYVSKDIGLLPYNLFTAHSLLFGSSVEVTLLSFALANKINIYKINKEKSQEGALLAVMENERKMREQNVRLENKVNEKISELVIVNDDLSKVLQDLKNAGEYLVESEKMSSLGQLTAGIAHEINNPINFVTSNIVALKRDIELLLDIMNTVENIGISESSLVEKQLQIDNCKEESDFDYLKTEISQMIKGISEGANRTATIIKGLRIFSREDEDEMILADINECVDSTLVLTHNLLNNRITIIKEYGDIPLIKCNPGKLNQVFLNIISNAIHAVNKKIGDNPVGLLKIRTVADENNMSILIEDNGTGMDDNTRKKIFEPFFTTKGVGEGTGLGMSIVYDIIKKHNGQIHINSILGAGTEFTIVLQINHF